MSIVELNRDAFAIWITGLPASGKSSITAALKEQLRARGIDAAVLESDALRKTFTPNPRYDEEERDNFYRHMADVGALLTHQGVPVIFDATANRRSYRERARQQIPRFIEVYVDCPLETCMARDPKGIYRQAQSSATTTVPGLQTAYEPPESPDLTIDCEADSPQSAATRVLSLLVEKRYVL